MASVQHLEFAKIAILVKWPISAYNSSSPFRNLHKSANMAPRYSQKRFSIWRPSAILHLKNFDFFGKFSRSEWKFVSVYQISSKSDNSRLRYGDKAIFEMAAVRRLEFAKIAFLVTWPISACDPSSLLQISRWSTNMVPRYSQKNDFQYGVRPPSWISYDIIILHQKTAFYVPNFVLNFHGIRFRNFWNIFYFMFQHFGLKLSISGLILTIFGEK